MAADEAALRAAVVAQCRWMNASGLNQGSSGNISVRHGAGMLITPSAVPYEAMAAEMLAVVPLDGAAGAWHGPLRPSTEWRFHRDILRARPEVGAVVHAHAPCATALSMARRPIPAAHYMVALFGGADVRCAAYATFGTEALSRAALAALEGRSACLLANHGMIATGPDLDRAMRMAVELEALARQYVIALAIGGPVLLTGAEIAEAAAAMEGYGPAAR
jgi:L-fuculose-phosphate aldolase